MEVEQEPSVLNGSLILVSYAKPYSLIYHIGIQLPMCQYANSAQSLTLHPPGLATADSATMIEIDHEAREVSIEQMHSVMGDISGIPPNRESVQARLNAPVSANHVDMDKISFERNKSGIWGWRSDKSEEVSGYQCKVYAASNVEFVSKTRSEHLSEAQANRVSERLKMYISRRKDDLLS